MVEIKVGSESKWTWSSLGKTRIYAEDHNNTVLWARILSMTSAHNLAQIKFDIIKKEFMKPLTRVIAQLILVLGLSSTALADEGIVVSSIDSAGYTYIEVIQDGQKVWLAVNPVKVNAGDKLHYEGGMTMTNFVSSSLTRTFPTMRFVNDVKVVLVASQPIQSEPSKTQ